jgi:glycosyltransferase involved in cell wall biosynthesis
MRILAALTVQRVVLCPRAASALAQLNIQSAAIFNPPPPNSMPQRNRAEHEPFRLLFVGTYGRRKGAFDLIEAFSRARAEDIDAQLIFVGREEASGEEATLREHVAARGCTEHILFAGVQRHDDLLNRYAAADAVCLPSLHDALPMAIIEAMAAKLPVIATEVGCIPDLVADGVTGILVNPGDIRALAEAIKTLARDPELARQCGEAGQRRINELAAPARISDAWHRMYAHAGSA